MQGRAGGKARSGQGRLPSGVREGTHLPFSGQFLKDFAFALEGGGAPISIWRF